MGAGWICDECDEEPAGDVEPVLVGDRELCPDCAQWEPPADASDLEELLLGVLDALASCHPDDLPGELAEAAERLQGASTVTFGQAGILTNNRGLVLDHPAGQFQITIVEA